MKNDIIDGMDGDNLLSESRPLVWVSAMSWSCSVHCGLLLLYNKFRNS